MKERKEKPTNGKTKKNKEETQNPALREAMGRGLQGDAPFPPSSPGAEGTCTLDIVDDKETGLLRVQARCPASFRTRLLEH